jgi:methylase of polypeptide subunit release factors
MVPHLGYPRRILEPAVGNGAIARILKREFPAAEIVTGDIATGQDFLLLHDYGGRLFDLIITNPPYSLALEFIQRRCGCGPKAARW